MYILGSSQLQCSRGSMLKSIPICSFPRIFLSFGLLGKFNVYNKQSLDISKQTQQGNEHFLFHQIFDLISNFQNKEISSSIKKIWYFQVIVDLTHLLFLSLVLAVRLDLRPKVLTNIPAPIDKLRIRMFQESFPTKKSICK